jgi:hypothetical protein
VLRLIEKGAVVVAAEVADLIAAIRAAMEVRAAERAAIGGLRTQGVFQ